MRGTISSCYRCLSCTLAHTQSTALGHKLYTQIVLRPNRMFTEYIQNFNVVAHTQSTALGAQIVHNLCSDETEHKQHTEQQNIYRIHTTYVQNTNTLGTQIVHNLCSDQTEHKQHTDQTEYRIFTEQQNIYRIHTTYLQNTNTLGAQIVHNLCRNETELCIGIGRGFLS